MRVNQKLLLLTINGSCNKKNIRLVRLKNLDLFELYNLREIRNFLTFNLKKFGIYVNLYARGQFKITIRTSWFTNYVLKNIEKVLHCLTRIMQIFYQHRINKASAKITQVACKIYHSFPTVPPNFKINYE